MLDEIRPLTERRLFGTVAVTAISDGTLKSAFDAYHHISESDLRAALCLTADATEPITHCIVFLIVTAGQRILIDTGSGVHVDDTAGRMNATLRALSVTPESIDTILLAHTDNDHVGGSMQVDGSATFPNARMRLHRDEETFRMKDSFDRSKMSLPVDLCRAALEAYSRRRDIFSDGIVAPGIEAIPLPGHKPGRTGFLIGDGTTRLFIWGDAVHLPEVQLSHPEVTTAYDIDESMAEVSRRKAFEIAINEGYVVSGMHLRWPPFAMLKRRDRGYALVEAPAP